MSPRSSAATDETAPSFAIRRDGNGVKMTWRTLVAIISAAIFLGGAWWTLSDHGKRLDGLTTIVTADHEILLELRSYAKATERARRDDPNGSH